MIDYGENNFFMIGNNYTKLPAYVLCNNLYSKILYENI